MRKRERLSINSAARNAVWTVPVVVPSRFAGGQSIVEYKQRFEEPEWEALTGNDDVSVELYGGLLTIKYDALSKKISPSRFRWIFYKTSDEAFREYKELWNEIREMATAGEVNNYLERWYQSRHQKA